MIMPKKENAIDTLGARVRTCRRHKGWVQEKLGKHACTSQAVIQKIENGKILRPRKLEEIAKVLDVNPAWLQLGDEHAEHYRPGFLAC